MLIFLYGSDTYRIQEKTKEIIAEYKKKYSSGLNLAKIDMSEKDISDLRAATEVVSMFSEKKLIILSYVFGTVSKENELLEYFREKKSVDDREAVIIIKGDIGASRLPADHAHRQAGRQNKKITKNSGLRDFLEKNAKCQKFSCLNLLQLKKWINDDLEKNGMKIGEKALLKMTDFIGNDLWRMKQELLKLGAFVSDRGDGVIEEADIKKLVKPKIDSDIFLMIDSLAQKKRIAAMKLLRKHLEKGEDELYILNMFVYQFRNIIQIKELLDRGESEGEIARELKMHPFVLKKSIGQAKLFSLEELKKICRIMFQADLGIKTGKIKADTVLELLIMDITKRNRE